MKKLASLGAFVLVTTLGLSVAAADEPVGAAPVAAAIGDHADAPGIKSPTMVVIGSVIGSVGLAQGVLGGILVANGTADGCVEPGCVNDAGMFGMFGSFVGTILLVDSGIKLAVAIPLIAVGASDRPGDGPTVAPPVALRLEVGPSFTGLSGTF